MFDKSIEYRSIIMRCDIINKQAFCPLPSSVSIEYYTDGMEKIWIKIQREAGEFSQKTDAEVLTYFKERFLSKKDLLKKCCIFLRDNQTGNYIGTCMAWEAQKGTSNIPILHWLAVSDKFSGQGHARTLITLILNIFQKSRPGEPVYLHTQPASYRAIKLYHNFGFHICRKDTYGTAKNEYAAAIKILKNLMRPKEYQELISCSVE